MNVPVHPIRVLKREDAPHWRDLRLEALRLAPTAFGGSYAQAAALDVETIAQRMPSDDSADAIFAAFVDESLVGAAAFHIPSDEKQRHKGLLWGVYVREAARGAGVGEKLVRAVIERARQHVAILQLTVGVHSRPARAIYDQLGFVAYGTERKALRVGGIDYDEVLMALDFENGL